jgi:two-component system, LytTR family, sensor kinase
MFFRSNFSLKIWLIGIFSGMPVAILIALYYGLDHRLAFVDAAFQVFLLLLSMEVLKKIFSNFSPGGRNRGLLVIIPAFAAVLLCMLHIYLLTFIFSDQVPAVDYWKEAMPLRLLLSYIVLVFFTLLLRMSGKLKDQLALQDLEHSTKALAREAELFYLRQQIQPHFLFNTLNSINALIGLQPEKAREMTVQLSDFLRKTIRTDHKNWIPLSEEMDHIRQYLDIEVIRFGDRLQVVYELSEEALQLSMPQLMLQPLLENAIKHGLYGTVEEVPISIKAFSKAQMLVVQVSNPYDPDYRSPSGTGFGLEGTRRRLQLLFGRNDLLKIEAAADHYLVTLSIPQIHD